MHIPGFFSGSSTLVEGLEDLEILIIPKLDGRFRQPGTDLPSLTSLKISGSPSRAHFLPSISGRAFFSLLTMNLQSLILENITCLAKSSEMSKICAEGGWKLIETLHIPQLPMDDVPPLTFLRTLEQHCPKLRNLKICIDMHTMKPEKLRSEIDRWPAPTHGLSELCIGQPTGSNNISVGGAIAISQYIDGLFPHIKAATSFDQNDTSISSILQLLQAYRRIRYPPKER